MTLASVGRWAAALALALCAAPAAAHAHSGTQPAPAPNLTRPMVPDPSARADFHLTWRPDPLAPNIAGFPYPHLTPGQLINHTDHAAQRKCAAANSPSGALRNSVNAVDWYCLDQQDSTSTSWDLQGMSGSSDAHPSGTVNGHRVFLMSWYQNNPPTRSRVSFLVADTGRYVNVELVRLAPNPTQFTALPTHAGGIVWHDNYLYVADPRRGLFVFDTRNILDLGRKTDPRAPGYQYVLPSIGTWATQSAQPCNRGTRACYDYVSLDRSATSWQFLTGEYCSRTVNGRLAWCDSRIARWRTSDITSRTPGRTINAQEVYRQPTTNVQGGVSYADPASASRTCYYFDSSRGSNRLGWLITDRPNRQPTAQQGGVGLQDLYVQRSNRQLWTVTEWPGYGKRILYGVSQPSCP